MAFKKRKVTKFNQMKTLFDLQDGKCFWCARYMALKKYSSEQLMEDHYVTIDHLDSKISIHRKPRPPFLARRRVAACYRCNQNLSKIYTAMANQGLKQIFYVNIPE